MTQNADPVEPEWRARETNFVFEKENFRFLVIRESWCGHKSLMFDSHATEKNPKVHFEYSTLKFKETLSI